MALLGPAMPLLRDDLGISRTIGGLHFSALALGSVLSGLSSARLIARVGRRRAILIGGSGVAIGALAVALGGTPWITITGTYVLGHGGNILLASIQAALSDHHGARRAVAIGEANAFSGAVFFLPGLVIALAEGSGIGWRWAFVAPALIWLGAVIPASRLDVPDALPADKDSDGRMLPGFPLAFWALSLAVAVEWSVAGWGAGYLVDAGGAEASTAAALVALFYVAMAVGRLGGSIFARRHDAADIVMWSGVVATLGFAVFWWAPGIPIMVAGLFVCGLGVANLFPIITSVMFELAPGRTDVASGRVSVSGGLAVLTAPVTLGWIADRVGLGWAFSLVPIILIGVMLLTLQSRRRAPSRSASSESSDQRDGSDH
jgi:MFS family permease